MELKIISKRSIVIGVIALLMFSSALFLNFLQKNGLPPFEYAIALPIQKEQIGFGFPIRLKIPKINVDSSVEYVGLASDGTMDVPKERANVAWFELGPRPGENGSAVIAGHYGINNKKTSAFDNLHRLRKGDKLYVEDEKGEIIVFVVRESRRYDPKADALGIFSSNDGKSHLNLVTCEVVWDEATQQYPKRLVVFTDREIR